MKELRMKIAGKLDVRGLIDSVIFQIETINPIALIATGAAMLALVAFLFWTGGPSEQDNEDTLERVQHVIGKLGEFAQNSRRALEDQQVQELAVMAATEPEKLTNLQQYVSGRIPNLILVDLFTTDLNTLRATELGPFGYAVLDMLLSTAETGQSPMQIHDKGAESYLAMTMLVGEQASPTGYLFAKMKPDALMTAFETALPEPGVFGLDQNNGRSKPTILSNLSAVPSQSERLVWLNVPKTLFRVGFIQGTATGAPLGILRPVFFVLGLLFLVLGLMLKLRPRMSKLELKEDPVEFSESKDIVDTDHRPPEVDDLVPESNTHDERETRDASVDTDDGLGVIELPDLGFSLEKASVPRRKPHAPIELVESIFRAYDIRGIVDETLDADVAYQVGQVVGTLTLEQDAEPVVVARDGRSSGAELIEGLINGISSTGCDVVDIGAVPTGVLYFAAYDIGSATGVMVTGSHNPPEYNGIKMVIGGVTQSGDQITDIYKRIKNGNVRVGKGNVTQKDMLGRYREKISSDIKLQRPLKVIADCGNGIAGVCAADVLRDIGAEVITLFDEVDGTFPNHHPDPSEPKNLEDLIEAVRLMDADIGVAFDGDADRLGVVTSVGDIIYSDRLMMLFAEDVLSRVPGGTIIYDVKCTGHLHHAIEEAGGKAMMYKTGHSLIKNKMKEVDAPFAGEMSGHFFFKERWYGFDCGIYSACRLLEILAADERDPQEVLNSLPNSISTPELKLHMNEGENHPFVAKMQESARFADAKITTIDGVRADFVDGWGLVRASNTTPILVLRFEADTEEAMRRIQEAFRQQMHAIKSDLAMPF